MSEQLWKLSATDMVGRLSRHEVTPMEAVDAAAARIAATDGDVNALPTLCLDRARDQAKTIMAMERQGADHPSPWLAGLPIAVKDLNEVAGVRTTWGSPIYADHVSSVSDIMVECLERHGAIVIGKSNTPEFGAGAATFNEVFGKTRNPWNLGKSVAGSSGGAAAALAAGQVWMATGSDLGGSLRTPASFNSVVGFRPTPGRVPHGPSDQGWTPYPVQGPMARNVADCALMLDAMVDFDARDPLAIPPPSRPFIQAAQRPRAPKRIAFSPDLGMYPVDPEVAAICAKAVRGFEDFGAVVTEDAPDLRDADMIFQTLRATIFATAHAERLRLHRDKLKPEVIWNIEKGLALSMADIAAATTAQAALYQRMCAFLDRYSLLVLPTAITPPIDVDLRYLDSIGDVKFDTYLDWLGIVYAITVTTCPSISIPAGFTKSGLPVGLQIVGRPKCEAMVLAAAAALEGTLGLGATTPIDPRPAH